MRHNERPKKIEEKDQSQNTKQTYLTYNNKKNIIAFRSQSYHVFNKPQDGTQFIFTITRDIPQEYSEFYT